MNSKKIVKELINKYFNEDKKKIEIKLEKDIFNELEKLENKRSHYKKLDKLSKKSSLHKIKEKIEELSNNIDVSEQEINRIISKFDKGE